MTADVREATPTDSVERALVLVYDEKEVAELLSEHLYPSWSITPLKCGGWLASRLKSVTPAQRAAGVVSSFGRLRIYEIATELARMEETLDAGY